MKVVTSHSHTANMAVLVIELERVQMSRQYDFIFSFMPTFFFLVYFTLSHVTLLSHRSHVQSHDGSPDLSHDEGT